MRGTARAGVGPAALAALALLAAACGRGTTAQGSHPDADQVDATTTPAIGACRDLVPADLRLPTNASTVVDCGAEHTAETIAAGTLPSSLADGGPDDPDVADWAARTCAAAFADHLGADESTAMRTVLDWVWFGPSDRAWHDGARWYRCDLTAGTASSRSLEPLPEQTTDLLRGVPEDRWMACARGRDVDTGERVACDQEHTWRAATTIKLGEPADPYPGDDVVQHRTAAFCQDSVAAWLGYPDRYGFGYTWFHRAEWDQGNRRSVCWARTTH